MRVNKTKNTITVTRGSKERVFQFDNVFTEGGVDGPPDEIDEKVDTRHHVMKAIYRSSIEVCENCSTL